MDSNLTNLGSRSDLFDEHGMPIFDKAVLLSEEFEPDSTRSNSKIRALLISGRWIPEGDSTISGRRLRGRAYRNVCHGADRLLSGEGEDPTAERSCVRIARRRG